MAEMTDELLFYGGLILAGGSLVTAVFCFCIFQMNKIRLIARLDMEYGKQEKE